jgi:hypothetical protein
MRILKARFVALAFNPDFFFDKWKSHHFSAICQAWFHARLQTHRGWVKTWFLRWRNMISNGFENGYYPRLSMIIYGFNWIIQDLDYPRLSNWHIPKFNWIIQDYPWLSSFCTFLNCHLGGYLDQPRLYGHMSHQSSMVGVDQRDGGFIPSYKLVYDTPQSKVYI